MLIWVKRSHVIGQSCTILQSLVEKRDGQIHSRMAGPLAILSSANCQTELVIR